MDKPKPTEPQPSLDDIVERLQELEQQLEKLQDYAILHIKDLYEADRDQKLAILHTQQVLTGDLENRGVIPRRPKTDQPFQAPSTQDSLSRMQQMRSQALGEQGDQGEQSGGSTSGGSQLLRSMKK